MKYKSLAKNNKSHLERNHFFDGPTGIARYDQVKYPQYTKFTDKMNSFAWQPEEVDLSRDAKDFKNLQPFQKHIFTSNIRRQIALDSVQGRSPVVAFLPCVSLPELETLIETWGFQETIHSKSYTHIIRNVYPDPSPVFDEIMNIPEILDCAHDISKYYDDFVDYYGKYVHLGEGGIYCTETGEIEMSKYDLKKKLWLCLNSVNILEGIRFYVSFACSWAFAELKQMEGNAKIIKAIARDENVHLGFTQTILKNLVKENPDWEKIRKECEKEVEEMFLSAIQQEKDWATYLFKDGSIIGLNEQLLGDYVDFIAAKRMRSLGYAVPWTTTRTNPLPWVDKYINTRETQTAPQEAELTNYVSGAIDSTITDEFLGSLKL